MHNYQIEVTAIKRKKMASEIESSNYCSTKKSSLEKLNDYRVECLHNYRQVRDSTPGRDAESVWVRFNALQGYLSATREYTKALSQNK